MKLEERFEIRDHMHCGLSNVTWGKPRLIDKPISGLLDILKEEGINIDQANSEVRYRRGSKNEKIPLNFYLGSSAEIQSTIDITGYRLKSRDLKILLSYHTESDAPKKFDLHTPIGPSNIMSEIRCILRGEYQDNKTIEKIKEKIEDFYNGPPLELPPEELKKLGEIIKKRKGLKSIFQ